MLVEQTLGLLFGIYVKLKPGYMKSSVVILTTVTMATHLQTASVATRGLATSIHSPHSGVDNDNVSKTRRSAASYNCEQCGGPSVARPATVAAAAALTAAVLTAPAF